MGWFSDDKFGKLRKLIIRGKTKQAALEMRAALSNNELLFSTDAKDLANLSLLVKNYNRETAIILKRLESEEEENLRDLIEELKRIERILIRIKVLSAELFKESRKIAA